MLSHGMNLTAVSAGVKPHADGKIHSVADMKAKIPFRKGPEVTRSPAEPNSFQKCQVM